MIMHLFNVAEKINAIERQTGTTTTAAIMQKIYEFNKTKILMDAIHQVGLYAEGSLFFYRNKIRILKNPGQII